MGWMVFQGYIRVRVRRRGHRACGLCPQDEGVRRGRDPTFLLHGARQGSRASFPFAPGSSRASLTGLSQFIDATKKGGKGRFLNHSCNPNCFVAKWTVGKKMRMGIFTKRDIKQYEELTFNYNVDRYGSVASVAFPPLPSLTNPFSSGIPLKNATAESQIASASSGARPRLISEGWTTCISMVSPFGLWSSWLEC